jgi:hypothetical protein
MVSNVEERVVVEVIDMADVVVPVVESRDVSANKLKLSNTLDCVTRKQKPMKSGIDTY